MSYIFEISINNLPEKINLVKSFWKRRLFCERKTIFLKEIHIQKLTFMFVHEHNKMLLGLKQELFLISDY